MHDIKRILVISRMTRDCAKAIHYGIALSRSINAELHVLHIVQHPSDFDMAGWLPLKSMEKEYEMFIAEAKKELDEMIHQERTTGLVIHEGIADGDPRENILKTIHDRRIDLLVMLAHEQGHIAHFLFGHSIHEVVREMPCSILLVKKESDSDVSRRDEKSEGAKVLRADQKDNRHMTGKRGS